MSRSGVEAGNEEASSPLLISSKVKHKKPCSRKDDLYIQEECESKISICSDVSTEVGNLVERLHVDPTRVDDGIPEHWPLLDVDLQDTEGKNPNQLIASRDLLMLNHMAHLRVDSMPFKFRQPAIIGTLGPACTTVEEVYELMDGGMNIGRVNMSHIDRCSKRNHFQNIIEAGNRYGLEMDFSVPFGTMMDLKGPEIRTGMLQTVNYNPAVIEVKLQRGQTIRLTIDKNFENLCSDKFIYVDYEGLPLYAQPGMEIFISGRNIKLLVDFVDGLQIVCTVVTEGALRSFQQVHVPMLTMPMPAITEYDWECVELAVEMDVDIIVIPKTRNEEIVYKVKGFLDKKELKQRILVFAKISNYEGVRNIDAIIEAADGIVIHKHDLSLEIPCAKIFVAQKEIIAKCNKAAKPVVCCVELKSSPGEIAQYIIDGADCLMLTEETALGSNGPCAVETLSQIIREADAATSRLNFHSDLVELLPRTIEPTVAITMAAVETADKVQAAAILTITTTGRTAQLLSWFRPRCPVIAVTRFGRVARQLNMWRAVMPLVYYGPLEDDWFEDCNSRLRYAIAYGKDRKVIQPGDPLVLVTGYRKNAGFTNCLRVIFVTM